MMFFKNRRIGLLLAALGLILTGLLAGCGNNDDCDNANSASCSDSGGNNAG